MKCRICGSDKHDDEFLYHFSMLANNRLAHEAVKSIFTNNLKTTEDPIFWINMEKDNDNQ